MNFERLAFNFDQVYIFYNRDSFYNNKSYFKKQILMMSKFSNINIIEASVAEYRALYNHYKGHTTNVRFRILLEKAHEIINKTTDYDITVFRRASEPIDSSSIYCFNYKNLKNYLTQN